MKITSVVVNRNDGYKDLERGLIHFKSMLSTFDEVIYIDWNSPSGSFLWEIEDKLPRTGKIKHIVIPSGVVSQIVPFKDAQKCNEAISRNIGIRRATSEWVVSTNIDIIPPKREDLESVISMMYKDTFYTISRREAPKDVVYSFGHDRWESLRSTLYSTIDKRYFPAKVSPNDIYSLINSCGDFQVAHRDLWHTVKGFEEQMIHACYVDTNVQKKSVMSGYKLKDLYEPPVFHIEHGAYYTNDDGTRVSDLENSGSYKGDTTAYNDVWDWVEYFVESQNTSDWGLGDTEIEIEII